MPLRNTIIFLVAASALGPIPAVAAERQRPAECAAAAREKPTLNAKKFRSARFWMVTEPIGSERTRSGELVRLTLRHGRETAELGSGVKLQIDQGACNVYSNIYKFTLPEGEDAGDDGARWLRRASGLLREVASGSADSLVPLDQLAELLATVANDPIQAGRVVQTGIEGEFEGGALPRTYTVSIDRVGRQKVLTVGFYIEL